MTTRDVVCYYHDPVKARLLREAVFPVLRGLTGVASTVERGWLHGPHIRIQLDGTASTVDTAAAKLSASLAAYVHAHPSQEGLSQERLFEMAEAAGRAELVPPPYGPFEPDNTVRIQDPDPGAAARFPGSAATFAVRTALLSAGLPALEAMVEHVGRYGDTPGARVRAAVTVLTVRAATSSGGLVANHFSYRSHLELYLHRSDPDGRIRAAQDRVWRQHRREVTGLVTEAETAGDGSALIEAWRRWHAEARRIAGEAHDRGELESASIEDSSRRLEAFDDPELTRLYEPDNLSEFHRMLPPPDQDPVEVRLFAIERFCINLLYVLLAVADLTPAERYLASSLVCNAVEDLNGHTWREWLTAMAGSR